MQRWWYSEEKNSGTDKIPKFKKSPTKRTENLKTWKFNVIVNLDINSHEKVAMIGSCHELGNWDCDHAILLNQEKGNWSSFKA